MHVMRLEIHWRHERELTRTQIHTVTRTWAHIHTHTHLQTSQRKQDYTRRYYIMLYSRVRLTITNDRM